VRAYTQSPADARYCVKFYFAFKRLAEKLWYYYHNPIQNYSREFRKFYTRGRNLPPRRPDPIPDTGRNPSRRV